MGNKKFTKNMISWQSTIVKFRNGMLGLAICDKISKDDNDGDEVFMVYDKDTKTFIGSQRLCCYNDDLKNTLSLKGVFGKLNSIIEKDGKDFHEVSLEDNEWDIVNVVVYPYALDVFRILTSGEKIFWKYTINS